MAREEGDPAGRTIELREEELVADKQLVQLGVVRIRKQLVQETRTIEVVVLRETVIAEHLPAEQAAAEAASATDVVHELRPGETLRLQLVEEEIVVQKRPVVYEEVLVGKRTVQTSQTFTGTVQREEARITSVGDLKMGSEPGRLSATDQQTLASE